MCLTGSASELPPQRCPDVDMTGWGRTGGEGGGRGKGGQNPPRISGERGGRGREAMGRAGVRTPGVHREQQQGGSWSGNCGDSLKHDEFGSQRQRKSPLFTLCDGSTLLHPQTQSLLCRDSFLFLPSAADLRFRTNRLLNCLEASTQTLH